MSGVISNELRVLDQVPTLRSTQEITSTTGSNGVNFSVYSRNASRIELLLFDGENDSGPSRVIQIDPYIRRTYHYWNRFVPEVQPGQIYAYRLAGTKLIAAAGLYQVGSFIGDSWMEWNGRFRDDFRNLFRGECGTVSRIADRFLGSPEVYGQKGPEAEPSVNFIPYHDKQWSSSRTARSSRMA